MFLVRSTLALLTLAGLAFGVQGGEIYVVNNSISTSTFLARVDKTTGALTTIGPLACNCGYGLAFGPDGRLFASDTTRLLTLDPPTGAIESVIGPYGGNCWISALAFDPITAELYGIDLHGHALVTLSTVTGHVTTIGSLNTGSTSMTGLSWSLDGSMLYAINLDDGCLYTVDPATGNASVIGCGALGEVLDLATDPIDGRLYTTEWQHFADGTLSEVDASSGARTLVGVTAGADELEGMAFDPGSIGTRYCLANPNSTGAPARLVPWGSPSSSVGSLRLLASPVPNRAGVFVHGAHRDQTSFGNGFSCTVGNLARGRVVQGAGNQAQYAYDNSVPSTASGPSSERPETSSTGSATRPPAARSSTRRTLFRSRSYRERSFRVHAAQVHFAGFATRLTVFFFAFATVDFAFAGARFG
jgi:hypothetical protein